MLEEIVEASAVEEEEVLTSERATGMSGICLSTLFGDLVIIQ